MKPFSALSDNLESQIGERDLIVFDGECVLCSRFFHFVLRHDHAQRFFFATAQSKLGQSFYEELDLPTDNFETILVIVDGQIYQSLDAVSIVLKTFGGVWHFGAIGRFLPRKIKNLIYFGVAQRRYRLFGRLDSCMVPSEGVRARFIS